VQQRSREEKDIHGCIEPVRVQLVLVDILLLRRFLLRIGLKGPVWAF